MNGDYEKLRDLYNEGLRQKQYSSTLSKVSEGTGDMTNTLERIMIGFQSPNWEGPFVLL